MDTRVGSRGGHPRDGFGWRGALALLGACVAVVAGCVLTPPQYQDSSSVMEKIRTDMVTATRNPSLAQLKLGLVLSDNAQTAMRYQRERIETQRTAGGLFSSEYATDVDPDYIPNQVTQILKGCFKEVTQIAKPAEAPARGLDLVMVLDLRVKLGEMTGMTTSVEMSGIFMDPAGSAIETVSGSGTARVPYPAFRVRCREASDLALLSFSEKLAAAGKLAEFAGRARPAPEAIATTAAPASPQPLGKIAERWAVVIGVSRYKYADPRKLPNLKYADRDATEFAAFLKSAAGGSFPGDHVLLLTDEQATVQSIREALFEFLKHTVREDLVIIYYSGHGMPDPGKASNLYLVAYDSDPDKIAATGFPMWDLDTALRRSVAAERVVAFVDTCHSAGATEGVKGVKVGDEFNRYFDELAKSRPGRIVFTSSEGYEVSREAEKWGGGHGVFTWALLEGLRGRADANGDGIVTLGEVLDYVDVTVRRETANEQHPDRAGVHFDRSLPLGVVK